MKKMLVLLFISTLSFSGFSKGNRSFEAGYEEDVSLIGGQSSIGDRDVLIGTIIKSLLDKNHYLHGELKIDDAITNKAFDQYIKRLDHDKQFLLRSDVKELKKMKTDMDDQFLRGNKPFITKAVDILEKRIEIIDKYRIEMFKKEFSYQKDEYYETDTEKRKFSKGLKELKEDWRKHFKYSTMHRYITLKETQEEMQKEDKKPKKKNKNKKKNKKKEEILTEKGLWKKAHKETSEDLAKFFARIIKRSHDDNLEMFVNAFTTVYDPHTNYFPPQKKEDFDIDMKGKLEGIGAILQEDGKYIKVVRIVPGGAAWRQKGLEADDIILSVDQKNKDKADLVGMRVSDAVSFIRGPKGTVVKLTVKKSSGTTKVIPIVRDVVQISATFAKSSVLQHKDLKSKIGYIKVPRFYRNFENNTENCTADVRNEIERLKKQKVSGIILDLRNNGGGALEDARAMSGLFIDKGPIVQVKNFNGSIEVLSDDDGEVSYSGPLIVMTNRFSASASEILAGAMKDYGRAVVVGAEFSHGKGSVQNFYPLNRILLGRNFVPLGALKFTSQKFYRINGASTQYKGVTPNIIIPDSLDYTESREQDLDYSLKWDAVSSLSYKKWKKNKFNIDSLRKRSKKRVKENKRFKRIVETVTYLDKRKKDTKRPLNLNKTLAENKKSKKITEKFKKELENKNILVSNVEASLRAHEKIKKGEEAQWKEDFVKRKEDWIKGLRADAGLEESIFIMEDMIKADKNKSLSAAK